MSYSKFSLKDVKEQLGIHVVENERLFRQEKRVEISEFLQTTLRKYVPLALAINTEKSRSEWIIAPILAELRETLSESISVFSGKKFDVDSARGLEGFCDYLVSLNPEQYYISAPILTIVEAKNENIVEGLGQCLAIMVAAELFNEREHTSIPAVYGAVTTGTNWKFLKLCEQTAYIDIDEYYLKEIAVLMGILVYIAQGDGS
jgi:hypothetical protein